MFFKLYLYTLSYSCCFFVMFVYLRFIWTDRARAHLIITSSHFVSHNVVFTLNLLDGFPLFYFFACVDERKYGASSSFKLKRKKKSTTRFHWAGKRAPYSKIGYFIHVVLSQKQPLLYVYIYMYQKDKIIDTFFWISLACSDQLIGMKWNMVYFLRYLFGQSLKTTRMSCNCSVWLLFSKILSHCPHVQPHSVPQ